MDFGEAPINIIFIAALILLMAANFFFRKRRGEKTPLGMVVGMLTDIRYNAKLTDTFTFHRGIKKFKTGGWKRGKDKVDFLPQEIMSNLSKVFEMTEDFNLRIDSAKKFGSDSYLAGIDVDKMKSPLAKSDQELTLWLQENMNKPEFAPAKRRGLLG